MTEILPISSGRLVIRAFRDSDAAAFHGWRNEADVARYTLWDCPFPMERAEAFCAKQAALTPFLEGEWYQLVMEEKATGRAIGDIGVGNRVDLEDEDVVTIGYSVSRAAHGKGYMTEALRALLPVLADGLKAKSFHAEIDVRNLASGRVLEKLGFVAGPVLPRHTFVKGEWCDEVKYDVAVETLVLM